MPLPTPNKGESEKDFVGRCIGHIADKKEFKDNSQRAAVCHSQWKKSKAAEEIVAIIIPPKCDKCGEKMDKEHKCDDQEEEGK